MRQEATRMKSVDEVLALARPEARRIPPYYKAPGSSMLRLDQNTNILAPSPAGPRVLARRLDLSQYPDRDSERLLAAIGARHGADPTQVVAGNGSDEVIDLVFKAFVAHGDRVVVADPSYSLYPYYAQLYGAELTAVPLDDDWRLRPEEVVAAGAASDGGAAAKLAVLASPNNPTANGTPSETLVNVAKRFPGVVVVDEAYIEYWGDEKTLIPRVTDLPNVIVTRTLSKAYGLAGARIGYAVAHPEVAGLLRRVKAPFNLSVVSEELALEALQDAEYPKRIVAETRRLRKDLADGLESLGFQVWPSDANFLLTRIPHSGPSPRHLREDLLAAGIAARTFESNPRLHHAIRFTVGTADDNRRLLDTLYRLFWERGRH